MIGICTVFDIGTERAQRAGAPIRCLPGCLRGRVVHALPADLQVEGGQHGSLECLQRKHTIFVQGIAV